MTVKLIGSIWVLDDRNQKTDGRGQMAKRISWRVGIGMQMAVKKF
jgi:hypothetical protein